MYRSTKGNFRQIRVTATHELPTNRSPWGRFSVQVLAKPLNEEWTQKHVILRRAVWAPTMPLESLEDVVIAVNSMLEELFLPAQDDRE